MTRSMFLVAGLLLLAGFALGFFPVREALAHDLFPTIYDSTRTVPTTHNHFDAGCASWTLKNKNYFNDVSSSEVEYKKFTVKPVINSGTVYGGTFQVGNYNDQDMKKSFFLLTVPLESGKTYSTPTWNFDIATGYNNYVMSSIRTSSNDSYCNYVDYDRMIHVDNE